MKEEKVLHRNIPQMLVNAICARISVLLSARGTGKTKAFAYEEINEEEGEDE